MNMADLLMLVVVASILTYCESNIFDYVSDLELKLEQMVGIGVAHDANNNSMTLPSLSKKDHRKLLLLHRIANRSGLNEEGWRKLIQNSVEDHKTHIRDGHLNDKYINGLQFGLASLFESDVNNTNEEVNIGRQFEYIHARSIAEAISPNRWRFLLLKALSTAPGHSVPKRIDNAEQILNKDISHGGNIFI